MQKFYVCHSCGSFVTLANDVEEAIRKLWLAKYRQFSGVGLESLLAIPAEEFAIQPAYWIHQGQFEGGNQVSAARAWMNCPPWLVEAVDWAIARRYGSAELDRFIEEGFAC